MNQLKNRPLRILYAGTLTPGLYGTCEQRLEALRDLGHECIPVNTEITGTVEKCRRKFSRLVANSWYNPRTNRMVRRAAEAAQPFDVVWFDKALDISVSTFAAIRKAHPAAKLVGYSPDDMMNPINQSREFLDSLKIYDIYFTTKSYNVAELTDLGAKRVEFVDNAFHPSLHRPYELSEQERRERGAPVGFIGHAEEQRARSVARLAAEGIDVKVWGHLWDVRKRQHGAKYEVGGTSQWADGFSRTVCAFDINLAFLRKENRDLQTTRSIEIPACGAFMLAERTDEHCRLFEEGKEAEFFSSDEEMIEKVRYYLAHPDDRERIAAAGRARCLRGGYSNQDRLRDMLGSVFEENPGR